MKYVKAGYLRDLQLLKKSIKLHEEVNFLSYNKTGTYALMRMGGGGGDSGS